MYWNTTRRQISKDQASAINNPQESGEGKIYDRGRI